MRWVLLFLFACGSKSEEPRAATISIAGKSYTVKSAVVHDTHVALSTGTLDCDQVAPDAEVILSHGDLGWTLGGTLFTQIHTVKDTALADAAVEITGGSVVLRGGGVIAGQAITLAGTIATLGCPPE